MNEHTSNNFSDYPNNDRLAGESTPDETVTFRNNESTNRYPHTQNSATTPMPGNFAQMDGAAGSAVSPSASAIPTDATTPRQNTAEDFVNTSRNTTSSSRGNHAERNTNSGGEKTITLSKKKVLLYGFLGGLIACILVLVATGIFSCATKSGSSGLGSDVVTNITNTDGAETLPEKVAQKSLPSVVSINVYSTSSQTSGKEQLSSMGSGVILNKDGYIITNQHVIDGASSIKVHISDGEQNAKLVGQDESSDIAVLKVEASDNLVPIELANSDDIKIGQWAMSIGSPFGLEQSVATGIVSAVSRSQVVSSETDGTTKVYPNLIQTDAAINPGNSGGALVNANGQLIGINTLITSSSGNYSGVGFAIPTNYAVNLAKEIISGKTPSHAQMGITMNNVTEKTASQYGLSASSGAYVSSVTSGGPADKAGIQKGDIITKVDNTNIDSSSDLLLAVRSHNPGDTVSVTINRNGEEKTVQVTLGSDEGQTQQKKQSSSGSGSGNSDLNELWKYFFGQ